MNLRDALEAGRSTGERRTFLLCDDRHPDYFVARMTRAEDEVKPEIWAIPLGGYLPVDEFRGWSRHA